MRWIKPQHQNSKLIKRSINGRKRLISRSNFRSLRNLSIVTILCCLIGVPVWLWQSGWTSSAMQSVWQATSVRMGEAGLRVEEVLLQGREHESAERITRVLGIRRGAPILAINLQDAREQLEALPWVRIASVERQLPNTVRAGVQQF